MTREEIIRERAAVILHNSWSRKKGTWSKTFTEAHKQAEEEYETARNNFLRRERIKIFHAAEKVERRKQIVKCPICVSGRIEKHYCSNCRNWFFIKDGILTSFSKMELVDFILYLIGERNDINTKIIEEIKGELIKC